MRRPRGGTVARLVRVLTGLVVLSALGAGALAGRADSSGAAAGPSPESPVAALAGPGVTRLAHFDDAVDGVRNATPADQPDAEPDADFSPDDTPGEVESTGLAVVQREARRGPSADRATRSPCAPLSSRPLRC